MWCENRNEFYGFTQDPKTSYYMIVMNNNNSFCSNCFEPFTNNYEKWCKKCNAEQFQQNFSNWTSGNEIIDKFIRETQLNAKDHWDELEWIPYNKLENVEYLNKEKFSTSYKANWLDGPIKKWSNNKRKWIRYAKTEVAIKSFNINNLSDLIKEV